MQTQQPLMPDRPVRPLSIHPSPARALASFPDLEALPARYGLSVDGDCLAPLIKHGAVLAFDRAAAPVPFGLAAIFLAPAMARAWGRPAILKRIVRSFPHGVAFDSPAAFLRGNALPLMVVEQVNPFRQFAFRPDDVCDVHACIGVADLTSAPAIVGAFDGGRRHV